MVPREKSSFSDCRWKDRDGLFGPVSVLRSMSEQLSDVLTETLISTWSGTDSSRAVVSC